MKKLKLKALELGAKEVLSREQLKNVLGGSEGSGTLPSCTANCGPGNPVTCYGNPNGSGCSASDGVGCTGHDSYNVQYFIKC